MSIISRFCLPLLMAGSAIAQPPLQAAEGNAPVVAQAAIHRVVFQLQADGEEQWNGALNNLDALVATFGSEKVHIEVVTHGAGAGLVTSRSEVLTARIAKLQAAGVVFDICARTCKRNGIKPEQILPGVVTVDSGVAHVVRRQEEGWSYLKGGG